MNANSNARACYQFGILPWQTDRLEADIVRCYQPMLAWLAQRTNFVFSAITSRSYSELIDMFVHGDIQLAYMSPLPYVIAMQRNSGISLLVTELAWNAEGQKSDTYHSHFLALKSRTDIQGIEDLAGKRFGFVTRESASSFQYPNAMLQSRGIRYEDFFSSHVFLGSHPRVTDAIVSGEIDAGATWDYNWRQAILKHGDVFNSVFTSMPIPNLCIAAHPSVSREHQELIQRALPQIEPRHVDGLHAAGFVVRPDSFYDIVRLLSGVLKQHTEHLEENVRQRTLELHKSIEDLRAAKLQIEEHAARLQAEIFERRNAEAALQVSEDRFRALFEHSPDAIFILDAQDGSAPAIASCNTVASQATGYAHEELVGKSLSHLSAESPRSDDGNDLLDAVIRNGKVRAEQQRRRKDGSVFPVETSCCLLEIAGRKLILAIDRDISERKQLEGQLVQRALHDPLTGLPNRALFMDRLRLAFERSRRHSDYIFALVFVDLDRFKHINDTLGHKAGDQFLVEIAGRLQRCIRLEDTAARLGGDEFTLVLEHLPSAAELIVVAGRIQAELSLPVLIDGKSVASAASMGIVASPAGYTSAEDMLQDADAAMYRAKTNGKARFEISAARSEARRGAALTV